MADPLPCFRRSQHLMTFLPRSLYRADAQWHVRRSSKFPASVQLQQTAAGQQVHMNLVIAMCGVAKVFVGELVETGARPATAIFTIIPCRTEA